MKIIIIGGGHSGLEAANIISNMGGKVLLLTKNINNIGELSCNPSMGGIGKSNLIREIDSLGGSIGYLSTKSSLQIKKINISKGEAVNCTRSQICRKKYKIFSNIIIKKKNIKIVIDEVYKIIIKNNNIEGVLTSKKIFYKSNIVIICSGTFFDGNIFLGLKNYKEGRFKESGSYILPKQLKNIIDHGKLKTGTPPRISIKNINLKNFKVQKGDYNPIPSLSSWFKLKKINNEKNCWLSKSTKITEDLIKINLKNSSIYKDLINGSSPRYCPSIEDKIYRFYKKKHNIFLEPDGFNKFYPNGLSTSLPKKDQIKIVKSIKGLEKSKILNFGYCIEYTFFYPKNLKKSLESKIVNGLFLAGQINGTTGYEEASAQGIVAGINAYLKLNKKKQWYPNKKNSYIGVMISDIIRKNITEPYRIFTNKSINNLILRETNSNKRLLIVSKNLKIKNKNISKKKFLHFIEYNYLENINLIIKIKNQLFIYNKYKKYIIFQEKNLIKKKIILKNFYIPNNLNFFKIKGLSKEISENLNKIKPKNLKIIKNILNINLFNIVFNYLKNLKS
ncbi:tRNA uridine 5-carboxymethylaminomethyl modification enzyme GidA [Candidatus Nasuia deltocephalinicola]|uniref:tRNA uridine 5-carboxymethylaminomethyl modification enzyme MnmG n=1 Tax=Candidatus Nasuia deltocephalincola TaxID=1160784 RepID=A0A7G6UHU9_9PROT|nr:tRNA uridine 5-carboxymethylaminomethyl modification enzyme GidA [Candidatus Nasuia deltocephalinicola]